MYDRIVGSTPPYPCKRLQTAFVNACVAITEEVGFALPFFFFRQADRRLCIPILKERNIYAKKTKKSKTHG